MSPEERRTVVVTGMVLLLASLIRVASELRPVSPILPPAAVPETLLEETRSALEREDRMNTPLAPGEQVDPNRDPDVELARLPGIGPTLAARIVSFREEQGSFERMSDLLRVSGIGPSTLENIRPHVALSGPWPPRPARSREPLGRDRSVGRIDLNRASASDLESLPGIGPALSARIVEHRDRVGRFSSMEQLLDVPGIGPATLERIRPTLTIRR